MNGQIVLCKGVNDGQELRNTIADLMEFAPVMESVSVVPVGVTDYRDGLFPVETFDAESACQVIDIIEEFQQKAFELYDIHFIHASDEWYINAKRPFPEADRYDGYIQLENGVGMMRLMLDGFEEALGNIQGDDRKYECSVFSGVLAYDTIKRMAERVMEKFPGVVIHTYRIINDFYGHKITVTGLLTGQDIKAQLMGKPLGQRLLIPSNVLKADEDIFLDDMKLSDLSEALQVEAYIVKSDGAEFIDGVIGGNSNE
jgi:putative radical SAM enzyme (TIGR03279 family)